MYLKLNREIINKTHIKKPFEVIEIGVYKNIPNGAKLPNIRLFFSDDIEELYLMDFSNSTNKAMKYVEFTPKSKFTYHQTKQVIKSDFRYCKVITETEAELHKYVDLYFDTIK